MNNVKFLRSNIKIVLIIEEENILVAVIYRVLRMSAVTVINALNFQNIDYRLESHSTYFDMDNL